MANLKKRGGGEGSSIYQEFFEQKDKFREQQILVILMQAVIS